MLALGKSEYRCGGLAFEEGMVFVRVVVVLVVVCVEAAAGLLRGGRALLLVRFAVLLLAALRRADEVLLQLLCILGVGFELALRGGGGEFEGVAGGALGLLRAGRLRGWGFDCGGVGHAYSTISTMQLDRKHGGNVLRRALKAGSSWPPEATRTARTTVASMVGKASCRVFWF